MLKLLIKDYYTQKMFFLFFGGSAFIISFLNCAPVRNFSKLSDKIIMQSPFIASTIYITIYLLINYLFYADYKNNGIRLLVTLPIARNSIVYSKYFAAVLFITAPLIIFLFVAGALLFLGFGMTADIFYNKFISLFSFFTFFLYLISLNIPWYFKFDYLKALNINMYVSLFLFTFVTPFLAVNLLPENEVPEIFKTTLGMLPRLNLSILLFLAVFAVLIMILSIKTSIFIINKKDLF